MCCLFARLAEEDESRHLVKLHGGLEPLVELIDEGANHENKVRRPMLNIMQEILFVLNERPYFL